MHLFVNDDVGQTWKLDIDVTARGDGGFTYQFQLPNYFVGNYSVTATGSSSGTAMARFTDAVQTATLDIHASATPCPTAVSTSFTNLDTVCAHTKVTAQNGNSTLIVQWLNPSGVLTFTDTHGPPVVVNNEFDDKHIVNALGSWTVKACSQANCTGGNLLDTKTFSVNPRPATGLTANALGTSTINVGWTASLDASNISTYILERSTDAGATWTQIATPANSATTFSNTGLTASTNYCYRIKARFTASSVNFDSTYAPATGTVCATTASSIVATSVTASNATATFGAASVTLNATVTPASGTVNSGTVTFTVKKGATTVGTVTSGTVTAGAAGATFSLSGVNADTYTISASYSGSSSFGASDNSAQSPVPTLTVNKASTSVRVAKRLHRSVWWDDGSVGDGDAHVARERRVLRMAAARRSLPRIRPLGICDGWLCAWAERERQRVQRAGCVRAICNTNLSGDSGDTSALTVNKASTSVGSITASASTLVGRRICRRQ